ITAHPELILGSLGEFETCPDWVPGVDTARPFASMISKQNPFMGSITPPIGSRKFETCPDWGVTQNWCLKSVLYGRLQFSARTRRIARSSPQHGFEPPSWCSAFGLQRSALPDATLRDATRVSMKPRCYAGERRRTP